MMENSNLPIRTWYLATAFMTFSNKAKFNGPLTKITYPKTSKKAILRL